MPTADEVKQQIRNLDGGSKFLGRREIGELPKLLWGDERIERLIQGLYNNRYGILVATDRRVLFLDKSMFGGMKVEEFHYDKISSIQHETGFIFGGLTIFTSGNRAEIKQVVKDQIRPFADTVRTFMAKKPGADIPIAPVTATPSPDGDFISQLERLGKLRVQGVLSEGEFQAQKQKLLG